MLKRLARRLRRDGGRRRALAFGNPRRWSNSELRKFGPLFPGAAVNVSAWQDRDKEGGFYRDYFPKATSYHITNFGTSQGALQHTENELFLDLQKDLPEELSGRFATVFNHTTLEHVWDFRKGFSNICALSSDIVVIVVPWLQPLHSDYGDYWRFSPQAVVRLFEEEGLSTLHISWNEQPNSSVYVLAIGSRRPEAWAAIFPKPIRSSDIGFMEIPPNHAGARAFC